MSKPILTIASATHDDWSGCWLTAQTPKLYFPEIMEQVQVIFLDQAPKPSSKEDKRSELEKFVTGPLSSCVHSTKYAIYTDRVGTSASRSKLFELADADTVLVLDCHVELGEGALEATIKYFEDPAHHKDIMSGPILTDAIWEKRNGKRRYSVMATHYADRFRARMWGTWANTWQCTCGGFNFSTFEVDNLVKYESVEMNQQFYKSCPACNKQFPLLEWAGHEYYLEVQFGYKNLGAEGTEPFEIPGQGLGMFACRKDAWPGFNPDAWGFGGEELYIHEKFRILGGKAVCNPKAPWLHRFQRDKPATYPNTEWYKCRNLILEFNELRDLARQHGYTKRKFELEEIRKHFMDVEQKINQDEWKVLSTDPYKFVHGPTENHIQPVMIDGQPRGDLKQTFDNLYNEVKVIERDLNKHMPVIREVASNCKHVTEFSKRQESLVALAAAKPEMLVSHNTEVGNQAARVVGALAIQDKLPWTIDGHESVHLERIDDTDLLFIDTVHHADRMRVELSKFAVSVRRYIICRGTGSFGVQAEGGGPGLWEAIREHVEDHPEWFVMYHTNNQYGLTILSKNEVDRPAVPNIPWPPGWGPGTELKQLLRSMGIKDNPSCDCNAKVAQMDRWGIEECEKRFDEIVGWLKEGAPRWGWSSFLSAGFKALLSGLAFKIDPTDPFPSLVRLSIDKAKETEAARKRAKQQKV